jgi:hypothetical protein
VEGKPPAAPSDRGPLELKPDLEQIYRTIAVSKIKEAWIIEENLLKEIVDLEAIVIVKIERNAGIQGCSFKKNERNSLEPEI